MDSISPNILSPNWNLFAIFWYKLLSFSFLQETSVGWVAILCIQAFIRFPATTTQLKAENGYDLVKLCMPQIPHPVGAWQYSFPPDPCTYDHVVISRAVGLLQAWFDDLLYVVATFADTDK